MHSRFFKIQKDRYQEAVVTRESHYLGAGYVGFVVRRYGWIASRLGSMLLVALKLDLKALGTIEYVSARA